MSVADCQDDLRAFVLAAISLVNNARTLRLADKALKVITTSIARKGGKYEYRVTSAR